MKLRIVLGITAALGVLAACSGSAANAEPTEETQAAYVLMGLLDQAMASGLWMEQTATSPATFKVHNNDDTVPITLTISKLGNCQYQVSMQDNSNGRLDGVRDLRNADPDKVMAHNNSIVVPGMTGSCKESGGAKGGCDNFKADQSMVLLGVSLTHERASLKAFKAKYCQ